MQIFFFTFFAHSEGTKELRPNSGVQGNIQFWDKRRPFAMFFNQDPLYRLYFNVKSTSEKVYFGFRHISQSGLNNSTSQFRIKDPNGNIVYAATNFPTVNGNPGYISTYNQAVAGPKIGGVPSGGYNPFSYTPVMTGDFYIEFMTDTTSTAFHLDYFDLTIVAAGGVRQTGRLWSYCWDLSTRSFDNGFYGKMYVLTNDGYVSKVDFNGIEAFGFTLAYNSTGPNNLPNSNNENRKSISGNSTRPEYKIFLNDPDNTVYPSGVTPVIMENLALVDTPFVFQPALFTVKMSIPGTVEMLLDLNDTPGYQPNSRDVVLVQTVGGNVVDSIVWDGKDGNGVFVNEDKVVVTSASFYCGVTHLPLYDPETFDLGYIVNRVRPVTGSCRIFWDDSNFPDGTTNIAGQFGPAHNWSYFFGDERTMNTWWNGFNIDTMARFEWSFREVDLPVEFLNFTANILDDDVLLEWSTASETNNDFFTVERSADGENFEAVDFVKGAGNSNSVIEYTFTDNDPLAGVSYYRIKQTDFDGKFDYSPIRSVKYSFVVSGFSIFPNPINNNNYLNIVPKNSENENYIISVYSIFGQKISEHLVNGTYLLKVGNTFNNGVYYLIISSENEQYCEKVIVQ